MKKVTVVSTNYQPKDLYAGIPESDVMTKLHTNTYAILSLVFAFVFFPLGLIFGIIALSQIKKTNEDGRGLAIAGIIVSSLAIFGMLMIIAFISFLGRVVIGNPMSPTPETVDQLTNSIEALDEALIGNNGGSNVNKISTISNEDVNSIIREHCTQEWSNDFRMRAYCQEQQLNGYNNLMKTKPAGMSDSDYQKIKSLCQNEWENDFQMMAYCEEQQVNGWQEIQ